MYQKLGLGELKPTNITLFLADRTVKYPKGIVEDVIVKVNEFYYPVDFVILETEPVIHPDNHTPIILGRPFLATANAVINCRNGMLKLSFGNMKVELNVFNISKQPPDDKEINEVDMIESLVQETFLQTYSKDSLEAYLAHSEEGVEHALPNSVPLMNIDRH